MADSSTSSTSQSHSEKTQPFHFRATFETQDIQLIVNIRKLHEHTIKLSIKNLQRKQSYNTQDFELGFTVLLRCCVTVLVVLVFLVILFFLVVLGVTVLGVLVLLVTDFWEYIT
ncbi:hypothetical protein AHAS_Ahas02G0111600 [Arachis hypogaea]